jgi:transcriptional regulator with XRE-family HTH domain
MTAEVIPEWTQGDRLRKARLLTGLNTRDFAQHIGVSPKTVNNAEADSHPVRKIVLNAWAMATGVPAEWLRDGDLVRHQGLEPRTRCLEAAERIAA